jgi:ribonuclease P protein component
VRAFSLTKGQRLLRPADFRRLSKGGNRIDSEFFVILYAANGLGRFRLGITVSKRVGCAVIRNRVKRLVREHFRQHQGLFSDSYDVNVIAKSGIPGLSSRRIRDALDAIIRDISKDCKHEAVFAGTH